jgi:predicted TIM-barrel fold metal-dependent hydrolase
MNFVRSDAVAAIRRRIDHPVIDGDGHLIEYAPLVRDFLVEEAGADAGNAFDRYVYGGRLARAVPFEQRRGLGLSRTAFWGLPTRNTLDRATALFPELLYRRLDELGLDFALLYPTYGLIVTAMPEAELRPQVARAFNRYYAEVYAPYRDRLEPVAAIPMFTPAEALAELEHAVGELGLKTAMFSGVIPRPYPGAEAVRGAKWIDTLAHDSDHDYTPVWQRCAELGISPTFHAGGQGWGTRMSRSNYVYNHIGSFAAAGEAAARSLVFGGVPRRFPGLRFAFLEGGVAWGANLYADILGHFEKRSARTISNYDPAELDRALFERLLREFAPKQVAERADRIDYALAMLSDPDEDRSSVDEFAASGIRDAGDLADVFSRQFFFGCEADDPMNAIAFDPALNPGGSRLRAVFASDIGHWDVPDCREVLPEAWELVEHGHLDEPDFRAFVFENAVDLLTGTNPEFFRGTVLADALSRR